MGENERKNLLSILIEDIEYTLTPTETNLISIIWGCWIDILKIRRLTRHLTLLRSSDLAIHSFRLGNMEFQLPKKKGKGKQEGIPGILRI